MCLSFSFSVCQSVISLPLCCFLSVCVSVSVYSSLSLSLSLSKSQLDECTTVCFFFSLPVPPLSLSICLSLSLTRSISLSITLTFCLSVKLAAVAHICILKEVLPWACPRNCVPTACLSLLNAQRMLSLGMFKVCSWKHAFVGHA